MAQQNINIGTQDAKTGDTLFTAFTKTQANFNELYGNGGVNGGVFVSDGAGGGEFIRVQGWQQAADADTTVAAPSQTLSPTVRTVWTNDAGSENIQKLPSDASGPLWNPATNKIEPISAFDTYNLRIAFSAEDYGGTAPYITVDIDIGGGIGIIASKSVPLLKSGALQRVLFSLPIFTGATFLTNGGQINLTYEGTGTCKIFGSQILIIRESKNYV